ncbi:MAG: response regulator, partial [Candidatus Krumholzibacteriia bacterium]
MQRTILLVDDRKNERRLLYHALKKDYRVVEAGDGQEALALLDREAIDLVILDMHLPPDTGTAAEGVRLQRTIHERNQPPPIIIVTSDPDGALPRKMRRRGIVEFFHKPVDPDLLKSAV